MRWGRPSGSLEHAPLAEDLLMCWGRPSGGLEHAPLAEDLNISLLIPTIDLPPIASLPLSRPALRCIPTRPLLLCPLLLLCLIPNRPLLLCPLLLGCGRLRLVISRAWLGNCGKLGSRRDVHHLGWGRDIRQLGRGRNIYQWFGRRIRPRLK